MPPCSPAALIARTRSSVVKSPSVRLSLIDAVGLGASVLMKGVMFWPKLLSAPFSPSSWMYSPAPALNLQWLLSSFVDTRPSTLAPKSLHASASLVEDQSVSPMKNWFTAKTISVAVASAGVVGISGPVLAAPPPPPGFGSSVVSPSLQAAASSAMLLTVAMPTIRDALPFR